ncbi:MAG: TIGR03943 family protein, partial [Streptococcus sp.]|nr:TIGR03943 family protein [Streptococcus sp.]
DNAWVTVTGTISVNYYKNLKQTLPILNLTEVKEVSQPDNPYVYRVF